MVAVIQPRVVQVAVGPPGGTALEWSQLYISFTVEESTGRTPNKAKVDIYNLSTHSLQWLEQPGQVMQVFAGDSTTPPEIFQGDLNRGKVVTKRAPPNYITTLEAQDGKRVMQGGYFEGSYPAGTTRTKIRVDVLAANGIATGHVGTLPERVYEAPPSFSAPMREVLDELYAGELAQWSIQRGVFQLVALGQPLPGNAPVISSGTGMIGSPDRTDKGVKVSIRGMAPGTFPGGAFVISSRVWGGQARITKLTRKGDSYGKQWQTDLVGVPIG